MRAESFGRLKNHTAGLTSVAVLLILRSCASSVSKDEATGCLALSRRAATRPSQTRLSGSPLRQGLEFGEVAADEREFLGPAPSFQLSFGRDGIRYLFEPIRKD